MLVIRYFRIGKRNQPSFKIVVTDKRRAARGGRFVEEVGFWNPLTKEKILKKERIRHWISVGAQPSASLNNLFIKEKIITGKKIPVHKKKKGEESSTGPAAKAIPEAKVNPEVKASPEAPEPKVSQPVIPQALEKKPEPGKLVEAPKDQSVQGTEGKPAEQPKTGEPAKNPPDKDIDKAG